MSEHGRSGLVEQVDLFDEVLVHFHVAESGCSGGSVEEGRGAT